MSQRRVDHLMAQRVDVGIILLDMLDAAEGAAYLARAGVPRHVIDRVTHRPHQRRTQVPASLDSDSALKDGVCKPLSAARPPAEPG